MISMRRFYAVICVVGFAVFYPATVAAAAKVLDVTEVASGIFLYQGVHEQMSPANLGGIGNAGFIVGERAVAVIDSGGSPAFGRLLKQTVESLTDLPIEYLVLTHFHPDHAAGSTAFPDVQHVVAHENHAQAMTQRAQFYLDRFDALLPGTVQDVFRLPTEHIAAGKTLQIDLGERILSIEAFPLSHTDNDLAVHDQKTNTLWASDLVFAERTPSLDGSLTGWLSVLAILDERGYELTIPGHGAPGEWSELVAPQRNYLLQLRDQVRELLDRGMPLSEVLARHDASGTSHPSWALYAVQHGSNLAKAYSELEWE